MNPHSEHGKNIYVFEAFRALSVEKTVSGKIGKTTIIPKLPHPCQGDYCDISADQTSCSLCLEGRESSDRPLRAPFTCVASCWQVHRGYVENRRE